MNLLRWLSKNLGSLLVAFILAIIVWMSAVTSNDPNQERDYPGPIPIAQKNLDPGLILMGKIPDQVYLTLNAPRSIWTTLSNNSSDIRAYIDLAGLGPGEHTVPVKIDINASPVRVIREDPPNVTLTLETLITQTYTVTVLVNGDPATGYRPGNKTSSPDRVTISGPQSLVSTVKEVRAVLDISGKSQLVDTNIPVQALDQNGQPVSGITITPQTIHVTQPIELLGGYRNVIVKVVTQGQPAPGYRLTNILVSPPAVVVFSSDPQLVNILPGYVETKPLDLNGIQDDVEMSAALNLPTGIQVVNDQKVLVNVGVAAIDSNITLSLPVEVIGLKPGLSATVSPSKVDLIISGPVPVLDSLKPSDIRIVVDLTSQGIGTFQIAPAIGLLPTRVQIVSIQPSTVEVIIAVSPTPTLTPTPHTTATVTPRP